MRRRRRRFVRRASWGWGSWLLAFIGIMIILIGTGFVCRLLLLAAR